MDIFLIAYLFVVGVIGQWVALDWIKDRFGRKVGICVAAIGALLFLALLLAKVA